MRIHNWQLLLLSLHFAFYVLLDLFLRVVELLARDNIWVILGDDFCAFGYHPKLGLSQPSNKPLKTQIIALPFGRLLQDNLQLRLHPIHEEIVDLDLAFKLVQVIGYSYQSEFVLESIAFIQHAEGFEHGC